MSLSLSLGIFENVRSFSTSVPIWSALLLLILAIALTLSLPVSGPLNLSSFSLGDSNSSSLGVYLPPLLLWISGLSPLSLVSFPQLPKFPPLPATSHRLGPLFLSLCPPLWAACHPRPLPCWLPGSRPASLAVLGRLGNSSWFLEKTTGAERKALSLPGRPPPSLGPGGLSQSRPARGRKPCGFWLLPGGLRIWPPPPGQQPKYYSAGGVGGSRRRPRLKEAFRAARPGASCPQAQASGRPSRDLRWPEGRVLL